MRKKQFKKTTESFYVPLNGRGGFVEFNVDQSKWPTVSDPNLAGIVSNAVMISLYSDKLGIVYAQSGFPLDEPGVNAKFFDWKGQPK